jgi:hypothetical protein
MHQQNISGSVKWLFFIDLKKITTTEKLSLFFHQRYDGIRL